MMCRSKFKSLEKVPNDASRREKRLKDDVTSILLPCSRSLGNYSFSCHFIFLLAEMNKVQIQYFVILLSLYYFYLFYTVLFSQILLLFLTFLHIYLNGGSVVTAAVLKS